MNGRRHNEDLYSLISMRGRGHLLHDHPLLVLSLYSFANETICEKSGMCFPAKPLSKPTSSSIHTGGCGCMNNAAGRAAGCERMVPPPLLTTPPPLLTPFPNPLAAGRTAEGQKQKTKRRHGETEGGVRGWIQDHVERRV